LTHRPIRRDEDPRDLIETEWFEIEDDYEFPNSIGTVTKMHSRCFVSAHYPMPCKAGEWCRVEGTHFGLFCSVEGRACPRENLTNPRLAIT
jgi:hypothetical protein